MHKLAQLDQRYVWHPFTQMRDWERAEPVVLVRGKGAMLEDAQGNKYLDGNASIWTNLHGHNHPQLNRARSFIFSTAPVPAQSAAAKRGVELVQSDEGETMRTRLWANVDALKNGLISQGWKLPVVRSAILPLMIGDERNALELAERLREAGIWVPAVRYPTVARGEARLRVTVSAAHQPEHLDALLRALGERAVDA